MQLSVTFRGQLAEAKNFSNSSRDARSTDEHAGSGNSIFGDDWKRREQQRHTDGGKNENKLIIKGEDDERTGFAGEARMKNIACRM